MRRDIEQGKNPRDVKFELGEEIVARFHDHAAAKKAREEFIARFQKGALPEDIPEIELSAGDSGTILIANLLKDAALTASTSEALRMIKQGAVKIDGNRVDDRDLSISAGAAHVFQVGKRRIARVRVTE